MSLDELADLYQQLILDHSKRPRHFGAMADATHDAEGYNPLCGDRIHLYLKLADGGVRDLSFTGKACAICTASASMMTDELRGRRRDEALALFEKFHALLAGEIKPDTAEQLGKLAALAGVRRFPMRVKCATLPWHTFKAALDNETHPVSTE
jgi:nitrogen fixation protein NifU and related proteins